MVKISPKVRTAEVGEILPWPLLEVSGGNSSWEMVSNGITQACTQALSIKKWREGQETRSLNLWFSAEDNSGSQGTFSNVWRSP